MFAGPYVGAVHRYENWNVADNTDAMGVGVFLKLSPLLEEQELDETVETGFFCQSGM